MALFRPKSEQPQPNQPAFNAQEFEQRIMNQVGQAINAALGPVLAGINALASARNVEGDPEGEPNPQPQAGLTIEQARQMAREEIRNQSANYVPKSRLQGQALFRKNLTPEGRELFDRWGDEVEIYIDSLAPEQQANAEAWEAAFEFTMLRNHRNDYIKAILADSTPEDLPPHLLTPGGVGGDNGGEPKFDLTEDEKQLQPIFDRTYRGGFSEEQMAGYRDLSAGGRLNIDQMISAAKEKGLIQDASRNQKAS